jgi:hypothetical protein
MRVPCGSVHDSERRPGASLGVDRAKETVIRNQQGSVVV